MQAQDDEPSTGRPSMETPNDAYVEGLHIPSQAVREAIADAATTVPDIRYELVRGSFSPGLAVVELLAARSPAASLRNSMPAT